MASTTDSPDLAPVSKTVATEISSKSPDTFQDAKLLAQTNVMYEFASDNGLEMPAALIKNRSVLAAKAENGLSEQELERLASVHQQLTHIVAPATPQALLLFASERQRGAFLSSLALIPIVRHIVLTSLFFLCLFVFIGQLEMVNQENLQKGILSSSGIVAVALLLYLASCAGLGACFTSLYRLKEFITDANFDPRFNSTYWTSILLGVIAGLFISELLYDSILGAQEAAGTGGSNGVTDLGKPALALLGGFSANMVYKMLQRIVDSIESLFRGDQKDVTRARRAEDVGALKQKQNEIQMAMANRLVTLADLMESQPDKARSGLKAAIEELLKK